MIKRLIRAKLIHFSLLAWAAGVLVFPSCSDAPSQNKEKRYNVMMIVSDALRQDVLGCYGGEARTPNIDWLAQNGVRFENSYSTSPWTSPSVIGMITGNYASSYEYSVKGKHRIDTPRPKIEYAELPRIYVPDSEFLFVEALNVLGYVTEMQIENINASMHNNFQGFEYIPQHMSSREAGDSINQITRGGLYDSCRETKGYWHNFYVLRQLQQMQPGDDFFILQWILDPHSPYDPPEKFASKIEVDESMLPEPRPFYSEKIDDRTQRTETEQKFIRDLYIAEVESMDERVGFILLMLKHKNLLDNTIVIFTSDHGEQFGEHGLYEHGGHGIGCHYYEGLMKIPLLLSGPGIPKNKTVSDYVPLLDLIPTIQDLLGVKYKNTMQGRSFYPLIFGKAQPDRVLYFDDIQEHDQIDALLDGNYKLIALKGGGFELYDIASDPLEAINSAAQNPQRVESMFEKIKKHREQNQRRRKKNLAALGDHIEEMSPKEKQEIIKKLKSLGYLD